MNLNREDVLHDATARPCPRCGMARDTWPDDAAGGYLRDGLVYCCTGCRDGTGCTCSHFGRRYLEDRAVSGTAAVHDSPVGDADDRAPTAEEIRYDHASAVFLNELRSERTIITPEDYGDPNILKAAGTTGAPD